MERQTADTVVIGVGNADRGDDGVGCYVIGRLRERLSSSVELIDHNGETAGLLELITGADSVYLVDAARSGDEPGTIFRFDTRDGPMPAVFSNWSSHGIGVAEAIELARVFGDLPSSCVIYAIEGGAYAAGTSLSAAVKQAGNEVARRILDELQSACPASIDVDRPLPVR